VDLSFDATSALGAGEAVFTMALQPDGKVLVGTDFVTGVGYRILRLLNDGRPDPEFVNTNRLSGAPYCFAVGTNGSVLVGGTFLEIGGHACYSLALLSSNGVVDTLFNPQLGGSPSVFSLATQSDGSILVGGNFVLQGVPLKLLGRMTPALQWDTNFTTDVFDAGGSFSSVTALLLQPDGSILVGGDFYEVGGYWRRHLVCLDLQGHVDPCFDPGLGLGGLTGTQVRTLAVQADGRILLGGDFQGADGNDLPLNIARVMPQGECGAVRVYLLKYQGEVGFVIGTYPPGGTNYLQMSTNLVDWDTVDTQTGYFVSWYYDHVERPAAFFRVRKAY
jgi:hypothetical protein